MRPDPHYDRVFWDGWLYAYDHEARLNRLVTLADALERAGLVFA